MQEAEFNEQIIAGANMLLGEDFLSDDGTDEGGNRKS
jgi:hypothetical protein